MRSLNKGTAWIQPTPRKHSKVWCPGNSVQNDRRQFQTFGSFAPKPFRKLNTLNTCAPKDFILKCCLNGAGSLMTLRFLFLQDAFARIAKCVQNQSVPPELVSTQGLKCYRNTFEEHKPSWHSMDANRSLYWYWTQSMLCSTIWSTKLNSARKVGDSFEFTTVAQYHMYANILTVQQKT